MNFNDFGASLVTLFHFMVVNNWYVTCNMYCYVCNSKWPILFFILFWVITVEIMVMLMISFVCEIYDNTSKDIEAEFLRRENVLKFQKDYKEIEDQ